MLSRILLALTGLFFSYQAVAFTCYLTVAKSNCWDNYNLTVSAINTQSGKSLVSVIVPEGTSWARQKFDCQPGMNLLFQAQYTPVFWQSDAGKTYNSIKYWLLPNSVQKGKTAWNLTVCFPKGFSEVPTPPESTGDCKCDLKGIPPLKLDTL